MGHMHDCDRLYRLLGCFCAVGALSMLFARGRTSAGSATITRLNGHPEPSNTIDDAPAASSIRHARPDWQWIFVVGLALWLLVVVAGTEAWYRMHEQPGIQTGSWTLKWPEDHPALRKLPLSDRESVLLRCDESERAIWRDADGCHWQAVFCAGFQPRMGPTGQRP